FVTVKFRAAAVHEMLLDIYSRTVGVWRENHTVTWDLQRTLSEAVEVLTPVRVEEQVAMLDIGLILQSRAYTFNEDQDVFVNAIDCCIGFFSQSRPLIPGVIPWLIEDIDTNNVRVSFRQSGDVTQVFQPLGFTVGLYC